MTHQSHMSFVLGLVIIVAALALPDSSFSAPGKLPSDITGAYYFMEKPPKGFEDIDWIALFAVDANGREVPLNGFLRLKERYREKFVNFHLVNPTLKDRTLTFSTKVVRGIRYQFEGQFLKLENLKDNETVLKGHLIKFRNGRKVAEVDAHYSYFAGD